MVGADGGPVPTLLVARTVNVYAVPLDRPLIVVLVVVPCTVTAAFASPACGVTVYEAIGLPSLAGADHETVALRSAADAVTFVGAGGTRALTVGVTAFERADDGPVPTALVAATVNVYAVPLERPLTVTLVARKTVFGVCASSPMYGVTMYEVMALPPFAGALQVTVALSSPALAVTPVGAAGLVAREVFPPFLEDA